MKKLNIKGNAGLLWRNQNVPQEWAALADCEELIHRGQVAAQVDARTGGICYWPDCDQRIISYPHAVPVREGGIHHAVNRAGTCTIHSEAMRYGRDPGQERRVVLQLWLQRWYAERGLPAERWTAMAIGITPVQGAETMPLGPLHCRGDDDPQRDPEP